MSSDVDPIESQSSTEDGLIYPDLIPYEAPELTQVRDSSVDGAGLKVPKVSGFDTEAHYAGLERDIVRACLALLGLVIVLTYMTAMFGSASMADRAVELGALFVAPILGALGYALGRLQRAGTARS